MIKKAKLPTLLGIIILLAGTFAGVFFLNMRQVFKIGASPQNSPKDVRISNVTDSSVTISFVTDAESTVFVAWGENQNSLKNVENEDAKGTKFRSHSINIGGLNPNTQYYFKINSEGIDYDNNSLPWKFTTGANLGFEQFSIPISGTVITASGNPVKRSIVYLNISGYLTSTLTSDAGSYVFQLGNVRTSDLKRFLFDSEGSILENRVLEFSIQADGSVASAQINLLSAESVPPIIMGQTLDFRNIDSSNETKDPNASLNLPGENESSISKFIVPAETPIPSTTVILESVENGEVINTDKPEFFGKGPKGQGITITVHSEEEISESINIPNDGSWSWTPPQNLSPGAHTITIEWIDLSGITRSLTRNFIVQAAEAPAFTASQSGTTNTPSPTPMETSLPVSSSTPSATPASTPSATLVPVPETGNLTPTLFLFIMSLGILVFSFGIWKISENA